MNEQNKNKQNGPCGDCESKNGACRCKDGANCEGKCQRCRCCKKQHDLEDEVETGEGENKGGCANCESCDEYKAGWQRALADYENLKRDLAKVATESRLRIKAEFVEQLLPVMDNFDQAVAHAPELADAKLQNWLQGVTFIKQQFAQVLAEMGLEEIVASGHFDPHLHDVVEERESEQGAGEILEVISSGWKIGEMVIRPAKVIVSKGTE